jgi:DNA-binding transcriptional MerR regulator
MVKTRSQGATAMGGTKLKIGELARRTGISVRTLHYYDEIGLLPPSHRTETGYRLYTGEDIGRLQQILSLRQIGFTLADIRACLAQSHFSPLHVIQLHLSRLREQIELQQKLCCGLEAIAAHFNNGETVSVDAFLQIIEVMNMINQYYTPEQLDYLRQRANQLGPEYIHQCEAQWQDLIAAVQVAMENGVDPTSEPLRELVQRWLGLIQEFTGDDAEIAASLNTMYQQEGPAAASQDAVDPALFDYMGRAIAAFKSSN